MWQGGGATFQWDSALNYCETLTWGNYTDWHLPGVSELDSIVDPRRSFPATDPVFPVAPAAVWTSSTRAAVPGSGMAWHVNLEDGRVTTTYKSNSFFTRCVRREP
jgi:hypothetical protein